MGLKQVAILGSTGSIGQQTLEVIRAFPDRFQVVALGAGKNIELLAKQVEEFKPKSVYFQEQGEIPFSSYLSLEEIAAQPEIDLVVVATSGKVGLIPTLIALKQGKKVALANKEVLVMAGEMVTSQAEQHGAEILPLDSEPSALWQCLCGEDPARIARLILTASGGPFHSRPLKELARITPEETLKHPVWKMGKKVTVDSATLMNKGMEVVEAHWLFRMPFEQIDVVVHPEGIVHSMVEFVDGSTKAHLSPPDMRLFIQYALFYPERLPNHQLPMLDWSKLQSLSFKPPDFDKFPCFKLAIEAGKRGGTYPAVLCAADEVAVELFLSHSIGFMDIFKVVEETLEQHQDISHPSLEEILAADAWARETAINIATQERYKPCY